MNLLLPKQSEEVCRVIVRLTTSSWLSNGALVTQKQIRFLKRKSTGHNYVLEDVSMVGASETVARIINLNSVDDGIYSLCICNEKRDWETGCIDDYDFQLLKYTQP